MAISLWAATFASALLYGLPPRDATDDGSHLRSVLAVVSLFASWLPAWRASRIDVARVLRQG